LPIAVKVGEAIRRKGVERARRSSLGQALNQLEGDPMTRSPLMVLCACLCAALALASAAVAMPTEEVTVEKSCTVVSTQVVGEEVIGKLKGSNVDPSQARFATCGQAKQVMRKVTQLGLEEPRGNLGGFYVKPTVVGARSNAVRDICTFKGADTATFVKLTFAVQYKS
jgi:hypothetical protein